MASRSVRDLILRITGDPADATDALHEVAREVDAFGRLKAEATVDVNTKPAHAALNGLKDEVKDFGRLTEAAKIDLQTRGAEAQLDRLRQRLENLSKRDASPKVDIAVAKTVAQIELVERKLAGLGRRKVEVKVDVDRGLARAGQALEGVATAATTAGRGVGILLTSFSAVLPVFGSVGRALTTAASSAGALGPVFLALIPIVLLLATSIAISLVGALGSLIASFAAAAAGAAAMGVALAAVLGPVVLVAVAAFARLAAILKAVKESEEQAATQARRVRDAHQAQAAAAERLRAANAQLKATTVDAYRAMRDAAEDASDAIRGITDAELSRERAQLSLKQAQRDLADFRKEAGLTGDELDDMFRKFTDVHFTPQNLVGAIRGAVAGRDVDPLELADKILAVREAQQAVRNATDDVSDAVTRANDARTKEAEFLDKGLAAYPAYAAAVTQAAAAQAALARTGERIADARKDQAKQLDKLNPLERRFAKTFEDLKATLTRLVTPATNAIFRGVLDFFDDLAKVAGRPAIRTALTGIGRAIGSVFTTLGRELRRKETRDAFVELANAAARMIRALGNRGAVDVFRILLRIAVAALPFLEKYVSQVVGWLDKLAAKTTDADRLRRIVKNLVDHFNSWVGLARAVARLVGNFFRDAKEPGRSLADSITRSVNKFNEWLEKDPKRIENFFKTADERTKSIADSLKTIADTIKWIIDRADDLKDAFPTARDAPSSPLGPIPLLGRLLGAGVHRQHGGPVPGTGLGDIIPAMLEPGEFVIRRSIASAIGMPALHALNAGQFPGMAAGGQVGGGIHIAEQTVLLPAAPGHSQMGDARHQAAMFARELRRRGGPALSGGGVP